VEGGCNVGVQAFGMGITTVAALSVKGGKNNSIGALQDSLRVHMLSPSPTSSSLAVPRTRALLSHASSSAIAFCFILLSLYCLSFLFWFSPCLNLQFHD
jgi:hypothetical protein